MKNWMVYASGVFFFMVIGILFTFLITRHKTPDNQKQPVTQQVALSKTQQGQKDSSTFKHTVHSQVVGDEKYRGIRISVSPTSRTIELLQGYNDQVIKTETLTNNQEAYDSFAEALQGVGFSNTQPVPKGITEDNVCPLGQHYSYEIYGTSQSNMRTWSTSCSGKDGDFAGKADMVRSLFRKQIPDYEKFTAKFAL